jgi:hypothetical protein
MTENESQDNDKGTRNLTNREQEEQDLTVWLDREKKPLPEDISEYVQNARDELKQYEEKKKFYERQRKREIVLGLVDLLEEYGYPKDWLRVIISQELGDFISTSYIEKILAEKYPDEKKKVKEEYTRQLTEIPRNDDKISIELFTTGESIVDDNHDSRSVTSYDTSQTSTEVSEFKTDLEIQAEKGAQEIVKKLQKRVRDLETRCYQLDQLAQEGSVWKEKFILIQQEFASFKNKIINGTAQIEFGSEFLPVQIEYNLRTNQFSGRLRRSVE